MKKIIVAIADIYQSRKLIYKLAKNDLRSKFASSLLGVIWAFIQPLVTILVFWWVFEVGFRNPPVSGVPFIAWFSPAFLVWNFYSEALQSGTNCLMEYSYLVKKINFRLVLIPLVKVVSSAIIHLAFIFFIFILMVACNVSFSIYNIQVIYYFLCACLLLFGLSWLFSAVAPFIKDTSNIISILIQIGFWTVPIFWTPENMSPVVQRILEFNPMFYICCGYRDSFVDHIWFWERWSTGLIFWTMTTIILFCGLYLFRKLRPQFADVV